MGHKEAQCWAKKRGDPKTPGPVYNGNSVRSNTNNVQVCKPVTDEVDGIFGGNTFCYAVEKVEEEAGQSESWLGDSGAQLTSRIN